MSRNNLYRVAEIGLVYKSKIKASDRPQITSSRDAHHVLRNNWSDQLELLEEFNILLLNRANRVLGIYNVSKGGHSGTVVDAKVVFAAALLGKASSIILAHNHPSDNTRPSQADIDLTQKLKRAGEALDIPVIDHIILTSTTYYSFTDEGLI